MFRNYLKIAWRNLVRNKVYSIINIAGLAIGLCCFLLIAMYVLDELSFDKFHKKADRTYRINLDVRFGGSDLKVPVASDPMGAVLKNDYPQVEQYTRVYASNGAQLIKKGNNFINEPHVANVDSTFFDVFTFPAITGDTKTALNEPNTVVITESAAQKYFGSTDVLGKNIETNEKGGTLYKVTAVIQDMPENSQFNFDFLFSMKNVDYQWGNFLSNNFYTYIVLQKGTDYHAFEKNFDQVAEKYVIPQAKQFMQVSSMEEFKKAGNQLKYWLIPITKIHLHSDRSFEFGALGNIQYVYIFSVAALIILLIACINFMNLTTARSSSRAREVGIRKVLGTERRNLVRQFLSESTLMAVLSLLIAVGIAYLVLPMFNNISGKSMTLANLLSSRLLFLLIALPFVVGLIAGSYPAFYLSAFRPIEVLKGKLKIKNSRFGLRSVLVVVQFATSIILIVGTIVIYRQLNYIQNKNLGYSKDQVLIVNDAYALGKNTTAFKNEMLQTPGITNATITSFLPINSARNDNTFSKSAVLDSKTGIDMQNWSIDYDYIKTMGMQIVKGRDFSLDFGSDSTAVIINESAAKLLDYENPVGQKLYTVAVNQGNNVSALNIIGVVKDFHYETLRQNIGPLCLLLGRSTGLASFKVAPAQIPAILSKAETQWKSMAPGMPFSYEFMDDEFDQMYRSEQRVGKIALVFAVLAIFVACLGLFGLATFMAEQRIKEIGIRKVLGASVAGITTMLSKNFLTLVIVSCVFAFPVAWWAMNKWLEDFAYRINIGWGVFVAAGLLAVVIALLTVSFQAIKAAIANPIKSLRTE